MVLDGSSFKECAVCPSMPHTQTDNNIPKAVSQQSTPLVHIIKGNKVAFSLRQPKIAYLNDQFLNNMC